MNTKELQEQIISDMRQWQKAENASVTSTGHIIEKTKNPVVRLVMEIIQRDSKMHYQVQDFVADSLGAKTVSLTPEELAQVWEMIEQHIELEKRMMEAAKQLLTSMKGKHMVIQQYLIDYLLEDETKHNNLLDRLSGIKTKMYPYG
jgi:hypothetical protein